MVTFTEEILLENLIICAVKIRPIIDHLNESFQAIFSIQPDQSIDEHMGQSIQEWTK